MDDTRIDLSQLDESRTVPSTPQQNSPQAVGESSEITPATTTLIFDGTCVVVGEEQVAGTSDELLPEVVVTDTSQEGKFQSFNLREFFKLFSLLNFFQKIQ